MEAVDEAGTDFMPLRRSRLSCVFSSVGSLSLSAVVAVTVEGGQCSGRSHLAIEWR